MPQIIPSISIVDRVLSESKAYNLTKKWHNKLVVTLLPKKELKGAFDWIKAPFQYTAFAIACVATTPLAMIAHLFALLYYGKGNEYQVKREEAVLAALAAYSKKGAAKSDTKALTAWVQYTIKHFYKLAQPSEKGHISRVVDKALAHLQNSVAFQKLERLGGGDQFKRAARSLFDQALTKTPPPPPKNDTPKPRVITENDLVVVMGPEEDEDPALELVEKPGKIEIARLRALVSDGVEIAPLMTAAGISSPFHEHRYFRALFETFKTSMQAEPERDLPELEKLIDASGKLSDELILKHLLLCAQNKDDAKFKDEDAFRYEKQPWITLLEDTLPLLDSYPEIKQEYERVLQELQQDGIPSG